jgi:hypothetical protein
MEIKRKVVVLSLISSREADGYVSPDKLPGANTGLDMA